MNTFNWTAACAACLLACPADGAVPTVQVKGAKYDQRRNDTASTIVIGRDELTRHGDRTLADALVRVPGITIGAGGIRMRGLGNGYTQVLLDGVAAPAGFSLESLSPELIERIDIVKTASAELGLQGIAGTVNIILKKNAARTRNAFKAGVDRQRGLHSPSVGATLGSGSGAVTSSLGLTLGRTQVLSSSVDHEITNATGPLVYTERRTARHEVNTNDTLNLVPRISARFGPHEVSLRGLVNLQRRQARGENHETLVAGAPSPIAHSAITFAPTADHLQLHGAWVHALDSGAKLEWTAGADSSRRKSYFTFAALPVAGREATFVDAPSDEDGYQAGAKYSVSLAGQHQLVAGWEHSRSTRQQTRRGNDIDADGRLREDRYDGAASRSALFIQDDWQGKHGWSVSAGLRADLLQSAVAQADQAEVRQRHAIVGPVLQALYKPAPGGQVRLGLTRTYRAPSMFALIPRRYKADNNNNPGNPDMQGNPALRPERAWGLDAGYEHYLGKKTMLSASAFVRRIDEVTVRRLGRDQLGWVVEQANNGRADAGGVLLEAKLPLRQWWAASPDLDLRASAARNWSRVRAVAGPDNRLDEQDPSSANLALDYRAAAMPLTLSANFNYKGGNAVRWSDQMASRKAPARVLDLHAVWTVRSDLRLRAGALNVLGQDSVSDLVYQDGNSATRTSVAARRSPTVRLGLEMDLR